MSATPLATRGDRAWTGRCDYGNLGNRTTCGCVHCQVWRQRDAARLAHEAVLLARHRARQRARDLAATAARRAAR